jgi:hypothetical protein
MSKLILLPDCEAASPLFAILLHCDETSKRGVPPSASFDAVGCRRIENGHDVIAGLLRPVERG